jgi:hypothetical protein
MKIKKSYLFIIFLLLASVFAIKPLFLPGFFPIHDDAQVQRVFEMKKALADGNFPVRWVPDLGYNYGYPIFNFYAPLSYYFGGIMNLFGIDALTATKLMMLVGFLFAAFSMYMLAKEFWGRMGAIISSLLYLYAPYHAVELYVRGDTAEFWAYAAIPIAFLGVYKTYTTLQQKHTTTLAQKKKIWTWLVIGCLGYSAIILSHNLTAMMVTPFLVGEIILLIILSLKNNWSRVACYLSLIVLFGILLSAFYWLPTLRELNYTNIISQVGGGADYHDHFVCLNQLWESQWGYGGSTAGCMLDGLSLKIGKLHLIFALVSLIVLFSLWKKNKARFILIIYFFIALLISILLMLSLATPLWDAIPQMGFIQYPWRFLIFASFFSSLLGGGLCYFLQQQAINKSIVSKLLLPAVLCLSIGIIIYNAKIFVPQTIYPRTAQYYTNFKYIAWETSRISDEYLMKGIYKPRNPNEIPESKFLSNPNLTLTNNIEKTQYLKTTVDAKQKTDLALHLNYFPTWHVFLDGKQIEFKYYSKGFLIPIPAGKHTVEVKFTQTLIEMLANALSLTGVVLIVIGIIINRKESKHGKKTS